VAHSFYRLRPVRKHVASRKGSIKRGAAKRGGESMKLAFHEYPAHTNMSA
jgi:hypothetical protein